MSQRAEASWRQVKPTKGMHRLAAFCGFLGEVSLGLRDRLDTLHRPAGALWMVDGGALSNWWARLLSNVLEVPLMLAEGGEAVRR